MAYDIRLVKLINGETVIGKWSEDGQTLNDPAVIRPWVEAGWGYRPLIADMARHLPAKACLNTRVDPAMAVMLRYHRPTPERVDCPWTLRLVSRRTTQESAVGTVVWEGFRPRQKTQVYRLEHRHGED